MKAIKRIYPLTVFLALSLFSQASNAIIITSYEGYFDDGSKLVVDLKGYDYGVGSYYASPIYWDEQPHPPIEGFETFIYPSWQLQQSIGNKRIKLGSGASPYFDGLYFNVAEDYSVSMASFLYKYELPDLVISSESGVDTSYTGYSTEFSGGFFKTYRSPYEVNEPGSLALIFFGMAGLICARLRRKSECHFA